MGILFIIGVVVAVIIWKFSSDTKAVTANNVLRGGLLNKHKNFAEFCDSPFASEKTMELVRNDGKYLEYRAAVKRNDLLKGYIYLGIEDTFAVIMYCRAVSVNGCNLKGPIKELQDWQRMSYSDFDELSGKMIVAMASTQDYAKLQFD